jgi:hypothetical protein
MIWPFKKKEVAPCPCGREIGESQSIINYRCLDPDTGNFIVNSMKICEQCSEEMDQESKEK